MNKEGRWRGDGEETEGRRRGDGGRRRGDGGETEGRRRGDGGETEGRRRGDGGETEGRWRGGDMISLQEHGRARKERSVEERRVEYERIRSTCTLLADSFSLTTPKKGSTFPSPEQGATPHCWTTRCLHSCETPVTN